MVGLRRNEVLLCDHKKEWDEHASAIIKNLSEAFGSIAVDIQHIGSTAIPHIKTKPIIDIAVAVKSFDELDAVFPKLERFRIYKSTLQPLPGIVLCAVKNTRASGLCLYAVHIVLAGSIQWQNHIVFRNYMNAFPEKAKEYESLKTDLAKRYPND